MNLLKINRKYHNLNNKSIAQSWIPWAVVVIFLVIYLFAISGWLYESKQIATRSYQTDNDYSIQFKPQLNLLKRLRNRKNRTKSKSFPSARQLNNQETYQLAESESNLALIYSQKWTKLNDTSMKPNVNYCKQVSLTDPLKLQHNNLYWQVLTVKEDNIKMYLYNAYYDNRVSDAPVVVLITANDKDKLSRKRKWWCLLWFETIKSPVLVQVSDYYTMMGSKPGLYHPELITCPIPSDHLHDIPEAVSLQAFGDCDKVEHEPSNVLRVKYDHVSVTSSYEHSIGVCVQAFRFGAYDISVRLVEWLEMIKLMGADKIYFYVFAATKNIKKVLRYYQNEGFVDWKPLTLAGNQPNIESLYNQYAFKLGEEFWPQELIELNDCLYRNLYRHKYLAVFDVDEMIVPRKAQNWLQLIKNVESQLSPYELQQKAYYVNRHSHACQIYQETETNLGKPIPEYLYMSRHTYRSKEYPPWNNIKCFHRTDHVSAVHNHAPMRCLGGKSCQEVQISPSDSTLWHYRRNQSTPEISGRNSDCPVYDRSTWKFFDSMEFTVKTQLEAIFGGHKEMIKNVTKIKIK